MNKLIYLAGPEIFLENAEHINEYKRKICKKYNLKGLIPTDNVNLSDSNKNLDTDIFNHCIKHIESADLFLANITPFRGISADCGTSFEIGYAYAKNKNIFYYSNNKESLLNRASKKLNLRKSKNMYFDEESCFIEDFNEPENLMISKSTDYLFLYENNQIFNEDSFEKTIYNIAKLC